MLRGQWKFWGFLFILNITFLFAHVHVVDLHIQKKEVFWGRKLSYAIAVNQQIPAPTLRFVEGDSVTIRVHNHLDEGTSMHWHGILLPWQMDGVEGVTQHPIKPGETFSYSFQLKQSGTYWYHAHSGFQEQEGVYGAFVIDPKAVPSYSYSKDLTIVLSDWVDEDPMAVLSHLKTDGDYYTPKFPLQPSLMKFLKDYKAKTDSERQQLLESYKAMQEMRDRKSVV